MNCQQLVNEYVDWLRNKITVADVKGGCEITTPFLDRHNDHIQIFVVPTNSGVRITDDSYTISDLKACGCQIDTPNRQRILETILNGFGVRRNGDELYIEASMKSFPEKKHSLLQAMLAVNDMFMTSKQRVATLFLEDVAQFLDQNDVRYLENVEFTGKSGFTHRFDFAIPKSKVQPERLIRAVNNVTKDAATSLLFAWTDTREQRSPDSQFLVLLNDSEKEVKHDLLSAFQEYHVIAVPWSRRMQHIHELAA
jgi:hypothetical protein